jgi:hypothetical protein
MACEEARLRARASACTLARIRLYVCEVIRVRHARVGHVVTFVPCVPCDTLVRHSDTVFRHPVATPSCGTLSRRLRCLNALWS